MQLESVEMTQSMSASQIVSSFLCPMAADSSGYLTEKVPPNPQHQVSEGTSTTARLFTDAISTVAASVVLRDRRAWHPM